MQSALPLSAASSVTDNCTFPLSLTLPHEGGGDERSQIGMSLQRLVKDKESGGSKADLGTVLTLFTSSSAQGPSLASPELVELVETGTISSRT